MLQRYQPSGAFTGKVFAGAPLVLLGAAVLGVVYQAAMHWVPLILLEVLAVAFMCMLTGGLVAYLTKATHCRNRIAGAAVGLAAGLVAVAVSHAVEYRLSRPGIIALAPPDIRAAVDANFGFLDYCELRAEAGWTFGKAGQSSTSSPTVSGFMVYIFWGVEAVILIGAGTLGGYKGASRPYCEPCGKWADFNMLVLEVPEPSAEMTANVKAAMSIAALVPPLSAMTVPPPPPPPPIPTDPKEAKKQAKQLAKAAKGPKTTACLRYKVESCPQCKMLHTLAVEHEVITKRGTKTEKRLTPLHKAVVVSSEEVGTLAQLKA